MKKEISLTALLIIVSFHVWSQVSEYFFTQQNLTYNAISGGTQLWSGTFDNEISDAITIPSFVFNGTAYTSLYISANGFITFGSVPTATTYTPISSTATYPAAISAFGCNITQAETGSPEVRYQQVSDEFIIQWTDVCRSGVTGELISFQIRLNTTDNTLSFVYGGTITPGSSTTYPQIGLRGTANTDFNNRYITSTGGNWINSTTGTTNSRTMYFNSTTATVVPNTGLTFSWKPLYKPIGLKAEAISQSQINLSWAKNSLDYNVLLAYNTTATFGTPVNGTTYSAGNAIIGGGTVLFNGDGSSFNHTSLATNTLYYYKIWSYDSNNDYSTGSTASTRTAYALPYLQDFNATSVPAEWTTNMSVTANHGTCGTRGLARQISSGTTVYYAISPLAGPISSTSKLSFLYRIADNTGYPLNATELGEDDQISIQVSTDDGATFVTIDSIDQSNHLSSNEFANKVVSLAGYNGDFIKIRVECTWGEGNYFVDIDNVLIEDGNDQSYSASTTEQKNFSNIGINSTNNEIVCLHVVTQKSENPISANTITFTTTGCTNATTDLETAKVYYTATPEFATTTLFGSAVSNPSGTMTFTGSQTLAQGNNYFWMAYDIRSSATAGNKVDAQCTGLITSESGTSKTPTVATVTGARTIGEIISGNKTIPGDYATLAEAVTALNNGVVGSGGVIYNIAAGYTESITSAILLTATGSADDPIVFQKSGTGNNPIMTRTDAGSVSTSTLGYNGDAIIIVEGSDYITFDGIDVTATDQGIEYGYYIRQSSITDGCKNVTVKNAAITLLKGTSKYVVGICSSNNTSSSNNVSSTSPDGSQDNLTITGNTISNVFTGMFLKGSGYFPDQDFTIGKEGEGNTIQNFAGNNAAQAYGIYITANNGTVISHNTIDNVSSGGSAFTFNAAGIYYGDYLEADFSIEQNIITLASVSSLLYGIYNASSGLTLINNNLISLSNSTSTSSIYAHIFNDNGSVTTSKNINITNNRFSSDGIITTGNTYLIYNGCGRVSPSNSNIEGNYTEGTISRTGASGSFYLYYNGTSGTGTENISDNNFSNISLSGSSIFWGIMSSTAAGQIQNIFNNTISSITGGTGSVTGINLAVANSRLVYGNEIFSITGGGAITAISLGTGSNPAYVYKNNIYDLSSSSTSGTAGIVNGILVASGSSVNLYNNFISDLKTPLASNTDAIRGISITSTLANSTIGVYYNTVYLDATSTGSNFGSSGIYHTASSTETTAKVDLRNNIIVNNTTQNGGAYVVAFRRSSSYLQNYATTSNNNIFYAGTPGTYRLIYSTTACQTIEAFQTLVGPNRDSLSFSEAPPFVNTTTAPYNLRLTDGVVSFCEAGAIPLTSPLSITDDFDGEVRGSLPDIGADEFSGIAAYVEPPVLFTATSINSQQVRLIFKPNSSNQSRVVVYNTTGTFTAPSGTPVEGNSLAGGTVLYYGTDTTTLHNGLTPEVAVYYKTYCYNGTSYSTGHTANATPTVEAPGNFTTTGTTTSQIDLAWTKNNKDHEVLITSDTVYFSGNPVSGVTYAVGDPVPSGGIVIYKGAASSVEHTGLPVWSQHYYKIWSVDAFNYYSPGLTDNAITWAEASGLPCLQNFDGEWEHSPEAPQNWIVIDNNGSGTYSWLKETVYHSSPYGARGKGNGTCDDYLISPPLELPDTSCQISWWDKVASASSNSSYKVLLSTTGNLPESFTIELGDYDCTNTVWTQHFIDLSLYKGQTVFIAFYQYYSQSQYLSFAIDDVLIETLIPAVAKLDYPRDGLLTFSNPLLKWAAPLTAEPVSGYKVYLDENANPSTLVYDGTDLSFQTSGLANSVTYYWKVVPYNEHGEAINVPVWSFSTVTAQQLAESFEADFFPPVSWSMDYGWSYTTSSAVHGTNSGRRLTTSTPVKLITPLLEISSGDKLEFFEGTSSSTYQRIQILYSADKSTWNNLGDPIPVTPADWGFHSINLESLAGGNYYLAFAGYFAEGGSGSYIYIDHITGPDIVPVAPNAAQNPTPIDTDNYLSQNCTLSWQPDNTGGIPSGYRLYADTNTNPSTLVYTGTDPTYQLSSLLSSTIYYWKVIPFNTVGDATDCPVWSFTTAPEGGVQIGRGDIDYLNLPIYPDYGYTYSQNIYLQSEIGISNKRITTIYYQWNGGENGTTYKDWMIYMGHTTKTAFSSNSDWVPTSQMTLVFNGEVNLTTTPGWVEIILDTPFEYNNTDNLVIAVDENTNGYAGETVFFYGTESATARGIQYFSDETNPDPTSPPTADGLIEGFANIRLQLDEIPINPEFRVTPESKDFGVVFINRNSESASFTVNNNGSGTLIIQSIAKSGTDASLFTLTDANSYPVSLAANETMTVSVVFQPATEGTKNAVLEITDNLSGTPHQVTLTGLGVDPLVTSFPFTETFEDDSPTRNKWAQIQDNGYGEWTFESGASEYSSITSAHAGLLNARFTQTLDGNIGKLVSPVFDLSGVTNPRLTFWYGQEAWSGYQNELKVYYRTGSDQSWVEIFYETESIAAWTEQILDLPNQSSTYQIAFEGIDYWGRPNVIDDVTIESSGGTTVPETETIENETFASGAINCFNAMQTITVAGNSTTVEFESGSTVDLIAGQSIQFLPGFHAQSGCQMLARITTDGSYCAGNGTSPFIPVETKSAESQPTTIDCENQLNPQAIRIYPNPNNGRFTLELTGIRQARITICTLTGKILYKNEGMFPGLSLINLPPTPRGVYLVKVRDYNSQWIEKLIVHE